MDHGLWAAPVLHQVYRNVDVYWTSLDECIDIGDQRHAYKITFSRDAIWYDDYSACGVVQAWKVMKKLEITELNMFGVCCI